MGLNAATSPDTPPLLERLADLVARDGTAAHPYAATLTAPTAQRRDLADAVHALCAVHGTLPGVADEARRRSDAAWLVVATGAFAAERAFLSRLMAAAGPLPSTPRQAASEAALVGQRHALRVLASSDRAGCAVGVVAALALDWTGIRPILANAGTVFGLPGDAALPDLAHVANQAVEAAMTAGASDRAMVFGADQLLAQHRGLWSLLEARAAARHP